MDDALAMAVAVSLEPFRVGMTVLMINRPRPLLQQLAFLAGGFAMGIAVGVVVLFILPPGLCSTLLCSRSRAWRDSEGRWRPRLSVPTTWAV